MRKRTSDFFFRRLLLLLTRPATRKLKSKNVPVESITSQPCIAPASLCGARRYGGSIMLRITLSKPIRGSLVLPKSVSISITIIIIIINSSFNRKTRTIQGHYRSSSLFLLLASWAVIGAAFAAPPARLSQFIYRHPPWSVLRRAALSEPLTSLSLFLSLAPLFPARPTDRLPAPRLSVFCPFPFAFALTKEWRCFSPISGGYWAHTSNASLAQPGHFSV